jgi:hypothetical protein
MPLGSYSLPLPILYLAVSSVGYSCCYVEGNVNLIGFFLAAFNITASVIIIKS